eukprot:c13057_g1_i1.p1 GENE.c13057_g1_i1~~c13057_g1_i1.p1  ORF type:complete len:159 (-),score=68.46 c13057_g1_i1:117-593(-)
MANKIVVFVLFALFCLSINASNDITVDKCASVSDCSSCTLMNDCGWCDWHGGKCVSGTLNGPSLTNCSHWDYGYCTGQPCSFYSNECSCTKDPFCGWCKTSFECSEGTPRGSLFHSCNLAEWVFDGPDRCGNPQYPFEDAIQNGSEEKKLEETGEDDE